MPATDGSQHDGRGKAGLEEVAEDGALPYVADQNQAAEQGEEDSSIADPDADAEEAGRGDIVGGINMH